MIARSYNLSDLLKPGKALIIYGPRRVGKTTLLNTYLSATKLKFKIDSGDNIRVQQVLGSQDFNQILEYATGYNLIAIDEAQNIPNIGKGIKIIIDNVPEISVIATCSSSFDLAGAVGEPLTGRKNTIVLYPIAQQELISFCNRHELKERIEEYLIYGSYPEVIMAKTRKDKIDILEELVNSYLLKDVLALDRVKAPKVLLDMLKLIAFQVGSQVSLNEIATQVKLDVKTVGRYLDIFEKAFVIKRIGGFSRNLRNEVVTKAKYYFLDNGIRNAIITMFNPLDSRNDVGQLWENFLVVERMKKNAYQSLYGTFYFWRTYDGQELDFLEERDGRLSGYEFKWSQLRRHKRPKLWLNEYKDATFSIINQENYLDFVL